MKVRVVFLRDASPYAAGEAAGFDRTEALRLKNSGIVAIPDDEDAVSTDTAETDNGANGGGPGGAGDEDAGGGDGAGSGGTSADGGQSQPGGTDSGSSGASDGTEGGSETSTDGAKGGGEPNGAGDNGTGSAPGATVTQVEIPDNWRAAHHATKKKLAREISGDDPADVAAAEAVIEAEIARRAAFGAQA
ncbi:hypothetical protein [Ancylobacter defluvii]|uniref:Uncharacterized protein n=1 Tax=Ancylobacter defluvii TaxID=1282440 RepID=A0A9W6NDL9_9HYPH|nr:hypothetical protein [Ancylobacter defluvii]MBS7588285.1 hypothetical protein [Ancylobacter defluvii]GLK86681.1 hypothetical protein GCM10017653_47510 [Ancylobacter defluvii]